MKRKYKYYTCPCCGYQTLESKPPGTYDICPICYWEDDNIQYEDPFYEGGANRPSLYEAQRNFLSYGAYDKHVLPYVRKPNKNDIKDEHFKLVQEKGAL